MVIVFSPQVTSCGRAAHAARPRPGAGWLRWERPAGGQRRYLSAYWTGRAVVRFKTAPQRFGQKPPGQVTARPYLYSPSLRSALAEHAGSSGLPSEGVEDHRLARANSGHRCSSLLP